MYTESQACAFGRSVRCLGAENAEQNRTASLCFSVTESEPGERHIMNTSEMIKDGAMDPAMMETQPFVLRHKERWC